MLNNTITFSLFERSSRNVVDDPMYMIVFIYGETMFVNHRACRRDHLNDMTTSTELLNQGVGMVLSSCIFSWWIAMDKKGYLHRFHILGVVG